MDKAGGREQGAGGTRVLGLFTILHIVWFYCADLLKRDHVRAFEQWQQELEERRLRGEKAGKEAQAQNQSSGGKT